MAETNDRPIVGGQTTAQNEAVETVLKRLEEGELFVPSYQRDSDATPDPELVTDAPPQVIDVSAQR